MNACHVEAPPKHAGHIPQAGVAATSSTLKDPLVAIEENKLMKNETSPLATGEPSHNLKQKRSKQSRNLRTLSETRAPNLEHGNGLCVFKILCVVCFRARIGSHDGASVYDCQNHPTLPDKTINCNWSAVRRRPMHSKATWTSRTLRAATTLLNRFQMCASSVEGELEMTEWTGD